MPAEEFAVIYTPNAKKDEEDRSSLVRRRPMAAAARDAGRGRARSSSTRTRELDLGEVRARKKFIEAFKDPSLPLKLLIVTDMLLTGFDAPVEQVMFLDKPLRGAKLLQAIMRTNRPYPKKDAGHHRRLLGRVRPAARRRSPSSRPEDVELAVLDLPALQESFPVTLAEALALVAGMPAGVDEYEQMMWLLKRFSDDKAAAELFEERFQAAQSAYETLAPDPVLAPAPRRLPPARPAARPLAPRRPSRRRRRRLRRQRVPAADATRSSARRSRGRAPARRPADLPRSTAPT